MKRVSLTASLLALAGLLTFAPIFAEDDPAENKARNRDKSEKAVKADDNADVKSDDDTTRTKLGHDRSIPGCLEKLTLTEEQQARIRDIVAKYEPEIDSVWKQFRHAYRDTIRTEVLLITAIEDNLSEEQQQQVRNQRRIRAHEAKVTGKTKGASARNVSDSTSRPEVGSKPDTGTRPERTTEKDPANSIKTDTLESITLTPEQEEIAEELHDKYYSRLRTLSRNIDALHTRLVALEADELAEIEKVLNQEQLEQLRENRKDAPTPSKVAERQNESRSRD